MDAATRPCAMCPCRRIVNAGSRRTGAHDHDLTTHLL
jgi:hypothetical protein